MNKRRHARHIKRLTARFYVAQESFAGISSDVSESGLFIRTNRGIPVDTPIDIEMFLPGKRVSFLKGIVRRTTRTSVSTKNGMGVEIIERDQNFVHLLNLLLGGKEQDEAREEIFPDMADMTDQPSLERVSFAGQAKNSGLQESNTPEKRNHVRFGVEDMDVSGHLSFANEVKIINICMGGVMVRADRRLNIGSKYTLKIGYGDKMLITKAAVAWSLLAEGIEDSQGNIVPIYAAGMQLKDVPNEKIRDLIAFLKEYQKEADDHENMLPLDCSWGRPEEELIKC